MIETKNICLFLQNLLHIWCAFGIFIVVIYELKYVSKYGDTELILTSEIEGYNFTYGCSILNIFNVIFLLWVLFDKSNKKIITYAFILFVINLIFGLWSISLYVNLKIIGRFNDIIILQFNIFLIECSLFLLFLVITFFKSFKQNERPVDYLILAEPIHEPFSNTKDNIITLI